MWQCRLTVSKPVLKAPMESVLEPRMYRIAVKVCFQIQLAPLQLGGSISIAYFLPLQFVVKRKAGGGLRTHTRPTLHLILLIRASVCARVIENKHSTDVESPPPLPRVCMGTHHGGTR